MKPSGANRGIWVALLTGGKDRPYVFGLSNELPSKGTVIDLIGSDELDAPQVRGKAGLNFFKFRKAADVLVLPYPGI